MRMSDDILRRSLKIFFIFIIVLTGSGVLAQEQETIMDYSYPDDYIIGNITVSGVRFLDPNAIIGISGLRKYMQVSVPGEKMTQAVEKLWEQGLFSDVKLRITEMRSDTIFLDIYLSERPRISSVQYFGMKKSESQDIIEKVNLLNGSQVTDHVINNTKKIITQHFIEKGFRNTEVRVVQKDDPDQPNNVILNVHVDKNERVKISEINFEGNEQFSDGKLRRVMKNTKKVDLNFFKSSKYIDDKFDEDKESLVTFYNDNGYRDFAIAGDSMYTISESLIAIELALVLRKHL